MKKGILILKKEPQQSRKSFSDSVQSKYDEFGNDFLYEGGKYFHLYNQICNTEALLPFRIKITSCYHFCRSSRLETVRISENEVPIPDYDYFVKLYNKYEKSSKSERALRKVAESFALPLTEISKSIDFAHDKLYPNTSTPIKMYEISGGQTQQKFLDFVGFQASEFIAEFILDGVYNELFNEILKYTNKVGGELQHSLDNVSAYIVRLFAITRMAREKGKTVCVGCGYFRKLYNDFINSKKSPATLKQFTQEFVNAVVTVNKKIDSEYNLLYTDIENIMQPCSKEQLINESINDNFATFVNASYDMFFNEYIEHDGIYAGLYESVLNNAEKLGDEEVQRIKDKVSALKEKVDDAYKIAQSQDETLIPEHEYFASLYLKHSNSSPKEQKKTENKFVEAIDEMIRQIDDAYQQWNK